MGKLVVRSVTFSPSRVSKGAQRIEAEIIQMMRRRQPPVVCNRRRFCPAICRGEKSFGTPTQRSPPLSRRSRACCRIAMGLGTCSSMLVRVMASKRPGAGVVSGPKKPSLTDAPRLRAWAAAWRDGSMPVAVQPRAQRGSAEKIRGRSRYPAGGGAKPGAGARKFPAGQSGPVRTSADLRRHGRESSASRWHNNFRDIRVPVRRDRAGGRAWRKPQGSQSMMSCLLADAICAPWCASSFTIFFAAWLISPFSNPSQA